MVVSYGSRKSDKTENNKGENKMDIEILRNQTSWALKAMIKALELPISIFLNSDDDNLRLKNAKKVLMERKSK